MLSRLSLSILLLSVGCCRSLKCYKGDYDIDDKESDFEQIDCNGYCLVSLGDGAGKNSYHRCITESTAESGGFVTHTCRDVNLLETETGESCICQEDKCNTRSFAESVSKRQKCYITKDNDEMRTCLSGEEFCYKITSTKEDEVLKGCMGVPTDAAEDIKKLLDQCIKEDEDTFDLIPLEAQGQIKEACTCKDKLCNSASSHTFSIALNALLTMFLYLY